MTEAELRSLALAFPGAVEGFNMGSAFFKVNGKDLCRLLDAERAMLTGVPVEEVEMLVEADPAIFWANDHYRLARCVVARLEPLRADDARAFLDRRFRQVAKKADVKAWDAARG